MDKYDFSGWATRANIKCTDGRTIMKDAFIGNDGQKVPLVWNHQHNEPTNILGHALLENREDGVYAYCSFNDTESGQAAKQLVEHGDIGSLSIYANQLKQQNGNVTHGSIREVSLVLAGANKGAYIDFIMSHGEDSEDEALIFPDEDITLSHTEEEEAEPEEELAHADKPKEKEAKGETETMADEAKKPEGEKTVQDVWNTLNEEQKTVVYAMIGQALEEKENESKKGEDEEMKHNVFDKDTQENTLAHSDVANIINTAKRSSNGSLRDAFANSGLEDKYLAHAVTNEKGDTVTYGIADLEYLFPDARAINNTPDFISRKMDWVQKVIRGAKHTPFSRIKTIHADITMEEARAKGYVKGNRKTEEVFALLKRSTSPTTIYKKQKMDRDDIIDITDLDVVAFMKSEMRVMLDEELARAALVGDGRIKGTDDKISEDCIRPIYSDDPLYTIRKAVTVAANASDDVKAKAFIRAIIKARKDYRGSGNPTLFTTEDQLTDCLLLEDSNGRVIYDTLEKLKTALRVSDIVTVAVMEGIEREGEGSDTNTYKLMGILVNMADYAFGADKGGAINMFEDFDIDFNQQKYLIETRCSGALIKPYSAIVVEQAVAAGN